MSRAGLRALEFLEPPTPLQSMMNCFSPYRSAVVTLLSFTALWLSLPSTVPAAPQASDLEFSVELRDGSRINVETSAQVIPWQTVSADGSTSSRDIPLSDISELQLAETPASNQVAEIRRLVTQLADAAYYRRHEAERALLEKGGPFMVVISQAREHREPEVRYRVNRLLEKLEDKNKKDPFQKTDVEFDLVTLISGETLEGDIADWKLQCRWNGRQLQLARDSVAVIRRDAVPLPVPPTITQQPVQIHSLVSDAVFFNDDGGIREGRVHADFDIGPNGETLISDRDFAIDEFFAFLGCLLQCEDQPSAYVYISNFRFKQGRSRKRSIGNFYIDPESEEEVSYQGVMRVSFCQKDRPSMPATVNQVGLYLEIVQPKHTVVEAYNDLGHLVATTEATRNRSSFAGFDSNIPITHIRVRANSELEIDNLNQDFAADDLCFDQPQACNSINPSDKFLVIAKDGQRIHARNATLEEGQIRLGETTVDQADTTINVEQVAWFHAPHQPLSNLESGFLAMLDDGSVVRCEMDGDIKLADEPKVNIPQSRVVGVWGNNIQPRFPKPGDFEHGQVIAVESIRRLAFTGVTLASETQTAEFAAEDAKSIEQPVITNADEPQEEVVSDLDAGTFPLSVSLDAAPSVWFSEPIQADSSHGLVRTHDGQQFVIGASNGFELKGIAAGSVTLTVQGYEITIPAANVKSLRIK